MSKNRQLSLRVMTILLEICGLRLYVNDAKTVIVFIKGLQNIKSFHTDNNLRLTHSRVVRINA